jgi:ankyrin repeat protein
MKIQNRYTLLLEKGANPNSTEALFKKRTIMGWAAQYKSPELLKVLISHNGDVNLFNSKDPWSPAPIYSALAANRLDNLKLLIKHGENSNQIDNHQRTPIMAAVAYGYWEATYILLQAGAKIEYKNKWGETPIESIENAGLGANSEWRKKVFAYLLDKGIELKPRVPL